jgi:hypothetical protein
MQKYSSIAIGLAFGVLGAFIFGWLLVAAILRSSSSTASIGFIFVPAWCVIAFVLFFAFGYGLGFLRDRLPVTEKEINLRIIATILFVVGFTGYLGKEVVTGFFIMKVVPEAEQAESNDKLVDIFDKFFLGHNKFVLGAIAQSPVASPDLLDRIAHLEDPELYEPMGSLFPVEGKNRKGLAVMRLIALHPNVAPQTLEFLAQSANDDVLGTVASNKKLSVDTLKRLAERGGYRIEWGLAYNENTPFEILETLAKSEDEHTRSSVARNARTPAATLTALGQDRDWYVRGNVALNPSTPKDVILQLTQDSDQRVRDYAQGRANNLRSDH